MSTTTSRSARYAKWLSIPLGLVLSAGIVWQASSAAFSDSVTSPDNSWTAGSVDIWSDHDGRLIFAADDLLVPGSTETKTVKVAYLGTLDADLSFYGTNFTGRDEALADHIHLKITGPQPWWSGDVFDGSLAEFGETHHSFATGVTAPVTASHSNQEGVFTFEYTLEENLAATTAFDEVQGGTASIDFVLEAEQKVG